jgi:adenylate cyclase
MGYVHFQRANLGFGQEDDLMQAESFANRALEIAPDLPEGHLVLGLVAAWCRGKIQAAIAHFEQVLAEDPNNQDVLKWAGSIYPHVGRLAEATAMGERVIAADPMSPMSYMPLLFSRWLDGDYGAALEVLDRAWRADPSAAVLDSLRILLLIPMGRHDEVFALTKRIEDDQRSTIDHRCALFLRYALVGEREKALSWMSPEALATSRRDMQYSWWVACGYALLGDANSALDWLENAVERGFLNHRYLAEIDPILAPLRSDPRFQAVVARAKDKRAELEGRP